MTTPNNTENQTENALAVEVHPLVQSLRKMLAEWENDIITHNKNADRYDKWAAQNRDSDFNLYAKCERINACNIRTRIDNVESILPLNVVA